MVYPNNGILFSNTNEVLLLYATTWMSLKNMLSNASFVFKPLTSADLSITLAKLISTYLCSIVSAARFVNLHLLPIARQHFVVILILNSFFYMKQHTHK